MKNFKHFWPYFFSGSALLILSVMLSRNGSVNESPRGPAGGSIKPKYTLVDYARECEEALGEIPEINCLAGEVIPVTNSDIEPGKATSITFENFHKDMKCDNPSLLRNDFVNKVGGFNPCVPNMRVGRVINENTTWVWTCRRYFNREKESPYFDDINMIGHNKETGGTCFFVNHINRKSPKKENFWTKIKNKTPNEYGDVDKAENGTQIPAIRKNGITSNEAVQFWSSPKDMTHTSPLFGGSARCITCHDNDPFVHSPFIQQVRTPDGKTLVPSIRNGPYNIVGSQYFTEWKVKVLVSPEIESCTSCHRIGNSRGCGEFSQYAVGKNDLSHITQAFKGKAWMPQTTKNTAHWKHADPEKDDIKTVEFINYCCKKPNDPKCIWESIK